ncbi:MAG: hypothetical protein LBL13_10365 [Bacteroidales bacterium]|jgi:hypothetical protein|nr:hypothetical protein [Bacteroidales bacterium]
MARLRAEVVRKLKLTPEFRLKLALSMNLSEHAVMYNLKTNHNNNSLTKIDALNCIKELLRFDNIEQLLEK